MLKKHPLVILFVGYILSMYGIAGWFCAASGLLLLKGSGERAEYPLADLCDIALDSKDNIYGGSAMYGRIQKYSPQGRFIKAWHTSTYGKPFKIDVEFDRIIVTSCSRVAVYDTDGGYIESKTGNYDCSPSSSIIKKDSAGSEYTVRNPIAWPEIVKITPDGREMILVRPNVFIWLLGSPFASLWFVMIGMILVFLAMYYLNKNSNS